MSIRGVIFLLITISVLLYTFKKPKVGMFYFLCLLFLRDGYLMENVPEVYINWHMPLIAGWIILISWFFNNFSQKGKIYKPIQMILMIVLALVIFASKRNAFEPENTFDIFNEYIRMAILVFLIINVVKTEKDLKQLCFVLISVILFLVLYSYYRYKVEGFQIAIPSFYVDRNFFAESITAILPLAFAFYENSLSAFKKIFYITVVAAMAAGIILTDSRGGFLALFLVLFFLFLQSKKKLAMSFFGIAILVFFLPHIGPEYKARISTVKTYEEDPSIMARIASWKAGINMVKDHPVLGVGAGNFNPLFEYYKPVELSQWGSSGMSIHNMFLQIFSETGLTGGFLFVLIIISCFFGLNGLNRRNRRLPIEKRLNLAIPSALGVSLLGFCGAGYFLPGAYYSYIYIIFALIMASEHVYSTLLTEAEK